MKKATDWIKSHKPHTAAIAIAIIAVVAVVIAAASGAFSTADKQNSTAKEETADLVLNVTADTGWDANSTPAIAHITSDEVDFYHAVSPDAEGNKGTSTVTLEEGDYTVDFISPVNADGSAYELFDTGEAQTVTVDADATDTLSVTCEMTRIPADQVTDDMLQNIVDQTKDAVENGDETLKGDAGKDILDKLEGNVANNPTATVVPARGTPVPTATVPALPAVLRAVLRASLPHRRTPTAGRTTPRPSRSGFRTL